MASTLVQVADAVVTAISGASMNQAVTAARKFVARYDVLTLESDTNARATVVPVGMKIHRGDGKRRGTRGKVGWLYMVDVALHKRIDTDTDTEAATMVELYEQVNDLFSNQRLPGLTDFHFNDADPRTVFDTSNLDEAGVYLAVQTLTFAGER